MHLHQHPKARHRTIPDITPWEIEVINPRSNSASFSFASFKSTDLRELGNTRWAKDFNCCTLWQDADYQHSHHTGYWIYSSCPVEFRKGNNSYLLFCHVCVQNNRTILHHPTANCHCSKFCNLLATRYQGVTYNQKKNYSTYLQDVSKGCQQMQGQHRKR